MADGVHIDQWLWAARFFKTRSLAQDAVDLGRVRSGGDKVKPARLAAEGMALSIERNGEVMDVVIKAVSGVRGPAPQAQALYEETEASRERRARAAEMRRIAVEPARAIEKGRPTKKDGRLLRKLRGY